MPREQNEQVCEQKVIFRIGRAIMQQIIKTKGGKLLPYIPVILFERFFINCFWQIKCFEQIGIKILKL